MQAIGPDSEARADRAPGCDCSLGLGYIMAASILPVFYYPGLINHDTHEHFATWLLVGPNGTYPTAINQLDVGMPTDNKSACCRP